MALSLLLSSMAVHAARTDDDDEDADDAQLNGEQSAIVYDREFFDRYPNAVSVLDLIKRIPAGETIIDSGGGNDRRGFSSNDDRILINGKRVSGKANDSESALGRITVDQVEKIQIIRGYSPDVKVSSSESIINIVLKSGQGSGSGSWRADGRIARGFDLGGGGFLSYGGTAGSLEYFASAERMPRQRNFDQSERNFDGNGQFQSRLDESVRTVGHEYELSSNIAWKFSPGTTLRLNGLYGDGSLHQFNVGRIFAPDAGAGVALTGRSQREESESEPQWELGGDFESQLGEQWTLKLLGLASQQKSTDLQREDELIEGPSPVDDVFVTERQTEREQIGRVSLSWELNDSNDLEFGSELSFNRLVSQLDLRELNDNGVLAPIAVDNARTTITETRNESFVIHTWQISEALSLETQFLTEWSRIEQTGETINRSRSFFFLRPSTDFRYKLNEYDQLQISIQREVEQLDFGDFASSTDSDDVVVGGNSNLEPEKSWQYEINFEHRFADDGGRIKGFATYRDIANRIELIEIVPPSPDNPAGISGRGNAGPAVFLDLGVEVSIRMGMIGLPDLLLEPRFTVRRSRATNAFTGERRRFNFYNTNSGRLRVRHDVTDWGLSYGGEFARYGASNVIDNDEKTRFPRKYRVDLFAEYKLWAGMILRLEANNLNNRNDGRDRLSFEDGVNSGVVTSREIRTRRRAPLFLVSLRGTF